MSEFYFDELPESYSTEEECEAYLIMVRWPNGFCCPRCESESYYEVQTRKLFECKECRTQVSITSGTVIHKSKLPLLTWFKAIELLSYDRQEFSAQMLAYALGVNYRTAKLMLSKIKLALHQQANRFNQPSQKENEPKSEFEDNESVVSLIIERHAQKLLQIRHYDIYSNRKKGLSPSQIYHKWMDAFMSSMLYPFFLRYYQICKS